MKPIFSILALATLALAGCAPTAAISTPSPTQTSEVFETSEVLPTPTETPIPPTATPSALENKQGQALLGLGYEQAQLKEFTSFAEGDYSFPGDTVTYHGIIGTKADGTKDILAFKFSDNPNYLKLSGTEVMELGKEAVEGSPEGSNFSIRAYDEYGSSDKSKAIFGVYSASTGIVESLEKEVDGEKINFQSILMVTQDDNGNPRLYRWLVQMEKASKPDENLLENMIFLRLGLVSARSTAVHSDQELIGFFSKNTRINIGFRYKSPSNAIIKGSILFRDKIADEAYLEALQLFIDNHGAEQPDNLITVLSGMTDWVK